MAKHSRQDSDTIAAAKINRRGVWIAAAIAAVAAVVAALITGTPSGEDDSQETASKGTVPTTKLFDGAIEAMRDALSKPAGSIDNVGVSEDGAAVTVLGRTTADLVAVLVGPRPLIHNGYWATTVAVNRTGNEVAALVPWTAVVDTPPQVPRNYVVDVYYRYYKPEPPYKSDGPTGVPAGNTGQLDADAATWLQSIRLQCKTECPKPDSSYSGTFGPPVPSK